MDEQWIYLLVKSPVCWLDPWSGCLETYPRYNQDGWLSASGPSTITATVLFYSRCLRKLLKTNVNDIHQICMNTCKAPFTKPEKGIGLCDALSNINYYEGKKMPINWNTQANASLTGIYKHWIKLHTKLIIIICSSLPLGKLLYSFTLIVPF